MPAGDCPPLPPTLHGCVVAVLKSSCERTDAPALCDHVSMVAHSENVRTGRTIVNGLEYVPSFCDYTYMAETRSTGATLLAFKQRAGDIALETIAKRGGYARKSSVQEYFKVTFTAPLSRKVAEKLADAFDGLGSPPIERRELMALAVSTDIPETNAVPFKFEGAADVRVRDDLPVYGTALGAEKIINGEAIEQTNLNRGEILEYRKRPVISNGVERLYGLHVQGSSMYPAHREGAFLYVQHDAPLRIGDDVVVYLRPKNDDDDGVTATCVLVKRLVKRSAQFIELEQFNPEKTFRLPMTDVLRVDRVLTADDYA